MYLRKVEEKNGMIGHQENKDFSEVQTQRGSGRTEKGHDKG
jgi:hypothetical protein